MARSCSARTCSEKIDPNGDQTWCCENDYCNGEYPWCIGESYCKKPPDEIIPNIGYKTFIYLRK